MSAVFTFMVSHASCFLTTYWVLFDWHFIASCGFSLLGRFLAMAQLALDDPLALKKLLGDCAVPAPVVAHLDQLGYRSVALLGFAVPSDGQVDELIEKLMPRDLGESVDLLSPGASSLRRVIRQCFEACQSKGGSLPSEPVLVNSTRPKLSLAECKELKIKFAEHFPGELLTPESTPSYMFLANLKDQIDSGTWTWTSWRHRISEHAEMVFQENRKPRSDHQLLQRMLNQQDLMDFPEANVPSGGPVEPVLLPFQTLLANALAMLQLVHLIVAKKFHHKFNELALAVPVDSSLRPPNLQEVLAADKSVWLAVTSAMRDNSWSLSDTMSEIAYCRQDMQTALQPRPRAHQPLVTPKKIDPKPPPKKTGTPPPVKKDDRLKDWNDNWVRKHNGKGICMRWNVSKCGSGDACRFLHICPIPKADGSPCAQKHPAKSHKGAPH